MKKTLLIGISCFLDVMTAGQAASPRPMPSANTAHVPKRAHRPNIPNMPDAALSPGNADVGDGDSFGRSVKFLGYAVTDPSASCLIAMACRRIIARCVMQTGARSFSLIGNEAVIRLPARAAHSLLCFTLTPAGDVLFNNNTGGTRARHPARSSRNGMSRATFSTIPR